MNSAERLHAFVHGDVQGVGFRYFVERNAESLGLKGMIRNLPSGEVECIAEGPRAALEALLNALHDGPAGAAVEKVDVEWSDAVGGLDGFRVG